MTQTQIIASLVVIGLVFWVFRSMGQNTQSQQIPKTQTNNQTSFDDSKISILGLVQVCTKSIQEKEAFAKKYSFTKFMTSPTEGMGEMHIYKNSTATLYFSKYTMIYSSNYSKNNEYIQQAKNNGFTLALDKQEPDGHIITYKKGDIQIDFKEPNSTASLAVYRTKTDYKGNLNGMDYNNFTPSTTNQPEQQANSNQKSELQFDISKIKNSIESTIKYVNNYTQNTEDLNDKLRNQKGLQNIKLLESKNQVPKITNIDSAVKVLTIYNQNKVNLYEYLDPYALDAFLDAVTEDLYINKNGGKPELTKLYTEIGMPTDEIPLTAMGCIMKFLQKHNK